MSNGTGIDIPNYAVSPFYSWFNHSCDPNANAGNKTVFVCSDDEMVSVKDNEAGEEVCVTYIGPFDLLKSKAERAEVLRYWLGCDCRCSRCLSDRDSHPRLREYVAMLGRMNLN